MALLHRAELHPTKLELLAGWLPGRDWYHGRPGAELVRVAAYRFDDPADAVGIETMLVSFGDGPVLQVPLTYRDAPLDGADGWLIGTADHSVLGRRWVYDGCGDPVYAAALANAVLAGAGQAEEYFEVDGGREHRTPSMAVMSSGDPGTPVPHLGEHRLVVEGEPTRIVTDPVELAVVRCLDTATEPPAGTGAVLTGRWDGLSTPLPLAYATLR
ncbi:CG0192-related protein [Plantactinospora sonchi]|uniref:Maltokinase N-terminal cap domain-containing protein n=1 Tax=Plantactinospora sonchi TaxID=1544735 RepID=A0ABU7RYF0_9ACTN